ncbi:MAG: hypothetical protein ACK5V3_15795 [Bdellovibrionales bacterium]
MSTLRSCPRCNERTFEKLATHSHCLCCNYAPDLLSYRKSNSSGDELPIPPWAEAAVAQMQSIKIHSIVEQLPLNENSKAKKGSAA